MISQNNSSTFISSQQNLLCRDDNHPSSIKNQFNCEHSTTQTARNVTQTARNSTTSYYYYSPQKINSKTDGETLKPQLYFFCKKPKLAPLRMALAWRSASTSSSRACCRTSKFLMTKS